MLAIVAIESNLNISQAFGSRKLRKEHDDKTYLTDHQYLTGGMEQLILEKGYYTVTFTVRAGSKSHGWH